MDLGSNNTLLEKILEQEAILDGQFLALTISNSDGGTSILLKLKPRIKTFNGLLEITFTGLEKFDFYFEKECLFNIERYKFFKNGDGLYYLSLDPYDEDDCHNEDDCAVIISRKVSGRVVNQIISESP